MVIKGLVCVVNCSLLWLLLICLKQATVLSTLVGCFRVCRNCRQLHSAYVYFMNDKRVTPAMSPASAKPPAANVNCRNSKYPRSQVDRFPVPDEKVDWALDWPEYGPARFTSPDAIGQPWSDPEHRCYSEMLAFIIQTCLAKVLPMLLHHSVW